jgi:polyisoprenyl-teichoic acid--peptidoglycan teichoic acid transferase
VRRLRRGVAARPVRSTAAVLAALVLAAVLVAALRGPAGPASAATGPAVEIHSAHGASFLPALRGERPLFILALGSDARPGQSIERERADSIHIIGVNASRTRASILGFPRDSWVAIPGCGTNKINAAMTCGGPRRMVATLERLTGIHIDFWLLTSFQGLKSMVNAIGGVTVDVPYSMHDVYSGANLRAGRRHLKGWQALAMARNRHDTPNGDFSRSGNQGRLMVAGLAQMERDFRRDPTALFTYVAALWRQVRTDLSPATLVQLAMAATQVPPNRVRNVVVPGSAGSAGSASVVFLSGAARSIYADMRADGVIGR